MITIGERTFPRHPALASSLRIVGSPGGYTLHLTWTDAPDYTEVFPSYRSALNAAIDMGVGMTREDAQRTAQTIYWMARTGLAFDNSVAGVIYSQERAAMYSQLQLDLA